MRSKRDLRKYDYRFRSGLELDMADWLTAEGFEWTYESEKLPYQQSINGTCLSCGSNDVVVDRIYIPDFIVSLEGHTVYLEGKGRFLGKERTKHQSIQRCYPDLDIRLVFGYDNWLDPKTKKTKYSRWCERNDIDCIIFKEINTEWLLKI